MAIFFSAMLANRFASGEFMRAEARLSIAAYLVRRLKRDAPEVAEGLASAIHPHLEFSRRHESLGWTHVCSGENR